MAASGEHARVVVVESLSVDVTFRLRAGGAAHKNPFREVSLPFSHILNYFFLPKVILYTLFIFRGSVFCCSSEGGEKSLSEPQRVFCPDFSNFPKIKSELIPSTLLQLSKIPTRIMNYFVALGVAGIGNFNSSALSIIRLSEHSKRKVTKLHILVVWENQMSFSSLHQIIGYIELILYSFRQLRTPVNRDGVSTHVQNHAEFTSIEAKLFLKQGLGSCNLMQYTAERNLRQYNADWLDVSHAASSSHLGRD